MKRAAALFGGLAGLGTVVALAATPGPAPAGTSRSAVPSVTTALVGPPRATGTAQPAAATAPLPSGGSASQVVSGRVASTAGVVVDAGSPSYQGTEPATMTVS